MDKIWDPIHSYITIEDHEKEILDSWPVQRLRHINQLALSFLTYPSATHKRFEHSLGVMFLADRAYSKLFLNNEYPDLPELSEINDKKEYYRKVIRLSALLHDVGHLPFSHAAETSLLPDGKTHESATIFIIENILKDKIEKISIDPSTVAEIAVGEKYYKEKNIIKTKISHTLLSEIITGDYFGVDRVDYLLRDSYHIGLPYGRFDYLKLMDTLEILKNDSVDSEEPVFGISENGIIPMQSLILARYFMYSQVYFNTIRRIYNHHLGNYMQLLIEDKFHDYNNILEYTDNEIWSNMINDARHDNDRSSYADIIINRKHYKEVYKRTKEDFEICTRGEDEKLRQPEQWIYDFLVSSFEKNLVILDQIKDKEKPIEIQIHRKTGSVKRYSDQWNLLEKTPSLQNGYIFVKPSISSDCEKLLNKTSLEGIIEMLGK